MIYINHRNHEVQLRAGQRKLQDNLYRKGKRKRFYPGTTDKTEALLLIKRMEYEWSTSQFDLTLESYKLKNRQQTAPKIDIAQTDSDLLVLWDSYVDSLHLPPATKNGHYYAIRRVIEKHTPQASDAGWYADLREEWAVSNWRCKKSYLTSCINWSIEEGLYTGRNPYKRLKAAKKNEEDKIKPFSNEEIGLILEAFQNDTFCSRYSACKHSHYVPFVKFLFITGCRLGEGIGLTWNCVDLEAKVVTIKQALGKDLASNPNSSRKILKPTKTGRVRHLPINPDLMRVLSSVQGETGYVFKGHRGGYIGLDSFRKKVWKKVLDGLGLVYRYPYQTRHTVLSKVSADHGLAAASKLAGHTDLKSVSKHYIRFIGELPASILPTLDE